MSRRALGFILVLTLASSAAPGCKSELSNASPCPDGTTAQKKRSQNLPGFVEWCERSDGTRHGPYAVWTHPDGKEPSVMGTCADGKRHGTWTTFDTQSKPSRRLNYEHGLAEGEFTLHLGEKLVRRGTCKQGKPVGLWEDFGRNKKGSYDDSGRLLSGDDMGTYECALQGGCARQ